MPMTFEGQAHTAHRDPQHARAEHRVRRQAERLAHDRGPAVGADDPCGADGVNRAVAGVGQPAVFDFTDPRGGEEVHVRLVLDGLAQTGNERCVVAGQTPRAVHVGKHDRLRAVVGKHDEAPARGAAGQGVRPDAEVLQYLDAGRMQPFARQALGCPGIRFQQGHPGALPRVSERAQAPHRPRADDGHVVTPRRGGAHENALGCARRR